MPSDFHAIHPLRRLGLIGVLITGASSGIGRELALQVHDAGVPVVALGRDGSRLAELGQHICTLQADLADPVALEALPARLQALGVPINAVIHNAAIQHDGRMVDAGYSTAEIRHEIDVNLLAPIALTRALLPGLQAHADAWIVHVTSSLAYAPKRSAAVYSATKAGLHLFSDALRVQVRGSSVQVVEVVMPLVDTPMTRGRGRNKLPARDAARALLGGLTERRTHIYVGKAKAVPMLQRWAPAILARALQAS